MKYSPIYFTKLNCDNSDDVFKFLLNNLVETINCWDYFVNWSKVNNNIKDIDIELHTLNYLVGKDNIEEEFKQLLKTHPSIVNAIPVLLACRTETIEVLTDYTSGKFTYEDFSFSATGWLLDDEIEQICKFVKETGFLQMLSNRNIKSIPDYVLGVEVGLDSNGRKNRSGDSMQNIIGILLEEICQKHKIEYIPQANKTKVFQKWGINIHTDKSNRIFDFVVNLPKGLCMIETNYYGGGGSKLKSTAGEYQTLFNFLSTFGYKFIWITDGLGWKATEQPLREAFEHNDYLLNIKMISKGILEEILLGNI